MAFFLIVPSIMVISMVLVHGAASSVGLKIKYIPLAMCGVLSFSALFGAMKFSPNPDKFFFIYLGAMILAAAAIVTAINAFLIGRDDDDEVNFTEEVRRAYAKKTSVKTFSETLAAKLNLNKGAKVEKIVEDKNFDADFSDDEPLEDETSVEKFETLDELLKYAKSEKDRGNFESAIDAYQQALDDYPDNEYTPFAAVDLSAIYREQAAYTKAIRVYEEALELPAVKKNSAVTAEFEKKLAYIKTVQAVLLRHHALTTPFSKIPNELLEEIESEFNNPKS